MYVYKNTPDPTFAQYLVVVALGTVFWFVVSTTLDHVFLRPFMHGFRKQFPCLEYWHEFDEKKKAWYASYWFGIIHALFSILTCCYCLIYADGQPGTTWFTSKRYQLTMFPIQKYVNALEAGYLVQDFIFCISQAENDGLMIQTYAHHLIGGAGQFITLAAGGFCGSLGQVSWITEASTPFVNGRQILAWHHLQDTNFYVANGLMMTCSFFWARVVWYGYMIFGRIRHWAFVEPHFWETYYPDTQGQILSYTCCTLYFLMYFLQLFWFHRILTGCLKALGFTSIKSKDT